MKSRTKAGEVSAAAAAELQRLARRSRDPLPPSTVVDAARPKSSPLHDYFEWDDTIAAEQHRLSQARSLIAAVILLPFEEKPPVRAFVSLSSDRAKGGGYRTIESVMASAVLRQQLLDDALEELRRVREQYRQLQELDAVWEVIDKETKRNDKKKKKT